MTAPAPILQVNNWPTNAHLIEDVARLGYLREEWRVLEPTWGEGVFWRRWRPADLWACDLDEAKSPLGESVDFRFMPMFPDGFFDAVVLDGPYKLNGAPDPAVDARYGVDAAATWQQRMAMIESGMVECARVTRGFLLVKCQDQVCRNKVRWQTQVFAEHARTLGFGQVDRFDRLGTRPQPGEGKKPKPGARRRPQRHARHNVSTLLVFRRGWETRA